MPEEIPNLFEIMATTRSMRRLKPDPVPAPLIRKILEASVAAPSGSNMQRWRFLVIRDPNVKQTVGAYYKRAWDEVVAPRYGAGEPAPGTTLERFKRMLDAAQYLVARVIHSAGYNLLSFTRAFAVLNCQSALVCFLLRSASHASTSCFSTR